MKLSDVWFTALSANESGRTVAIYGREELNEFIDSGKYNERVEITWKYKGDENGFPDEVLGEQMELVEEALRKAMEKKDKLAILTSIYTGGGEKIWVFYTRTHSNKPVPFLIYKPGNKPDRVSSFDEFTIKKGQCGLLENDAFIHLLMGDK